MTETLAVAPPEVAIGALVAGRYRVTGILGLGGMARVVRAAVENLGSTMWRAPKEVALKLQYHDTKKGGLDARLIHELLAAARVVHPNVVRVHDFGVDPTHQVAFFAMDLLEGVDLAHQLDSFPRADVRWFLPLFCDALDGLASAHSVGIVHKDLKPANLFLDRRHGTRLYVTDFGIAHHAQRSRVTQVGDIACTPQYCPPEYIESGTVTPASDVYQMGLILAEALLGWPMVPRGIPFITAAFTHTNSKLALPRGWAGSPLGDLIGRAVARSPEARFPNAQAMRQAVLALDLEVAATTATIHAALRSKDAPSGP